MTEKNKVCWVCDSENVKPTIQYNDWHVYRCADCAFRFAEGGQPIVYENHYDEDYFAPLMQRDEMDKWSKIYSERLTYLRQHAPGKQLLEAGAGASTFALSAVDFGFDVNVVDAAPWAVDFLASHDGVTGQVTDLNNCQLRPDTYGAIHCSHVLEHLSNPRRFLKECLNCMLPGGLMYLSFPAYEGTVLGSKDLLYRIKVANHPYNYQAPDHLSYFSAHCIRQTLENIGFDVVRLRRRKFISLFDSAERIRSGGAVRRLAGAIASLAAPVTRRIGFHRDLEIIAQRPAIAGKVAA